MPSQIFGPRKKRTRQHVIADQSINHLERFILDAGHTAQRLDSDYGYDLVLSTYSPTRYGGRTMKKMAVTYGHLDKLLRSLGFTSRKVKGDPPTLRYDHKETGASFMIPSLPASQRVWEHHLVTAKVMVDQNGIADPEVFEAKLQKVG